MSLAGRLARLAKAAAHCPRCGGSNPSGYDFIRVWVEDPIGSPRVPEGDHTPPPPCPACGREPKVLHLVEQVVEAKGAGP
jgi:hypothetical protein